jgi:hypothetical protein
MPSSAEIPPEIEEFHRNQPWYTVGGFLTNHYIPALKKKVVKVIACICKLLQATVFSSSS